jgi:hypothetical protein
MRALLTYRGWFVPAGLFTLSGKPQRRVQSMLMLSHENLVPPGELWIFTSEEYALVGPCLKRLNPPHPHFVSGPTTW